MLAITGDLPGGSVARGGSDERGQTGPPARELGILSTAARSNRRAFPDYAQWFATPWQTS